jgi:hypothetical protein
MLPGIKNVNDMQQDVSISRKCRLLLEGRYAVGASVRSIAVDTLCRAKDLCPGLYSLGHVFKEGCVCYVCNGYFGSLKMALGSGSLCY